jgi:hypothetical protein
LHRFAVAATCQQKKRFIATSRAGAAALHRFAVAATCHQKKRFIATSPDDMEKK